MAVLSFDKFVNFLIHREIQFVPASLFTDQNEMRLLEAPKGEPKATPQRAKRTEKQIRQCGTQSAFTSNVLLEVIDVWPMLRYIYISPLSSTWLESTVTETISKLAPLVEVPIRKSTIQDE